MTTINKVTTLRSPQSLTDEQIQAHLDEQNLDGWHLLCVDNLVGWYRFFWSKETE
jgi:hypothetical protein